MDNATIKKVKIMNKDRKNKKLQIAGWFKEDGFIASDEFKEILDDLSDNEVDYVKFVRLLEELHKDGLLEAKKRYIIETIMIFHKYFKEEPICGFFN